MLQSSVAYSAINRRIHLILNQNRKILKKLVDNGKIQFQKRNCFLGIIISIIILAPFILQIIDPFIIAMIIDFVY